MDVDDGSKEGGDQNSDKKDDKEGKPARRKRQADTTAKTSTQPNTKATTQGPTSPKSTTPKSAKMVPGKVSLMFCTHSRLEYTEVSGLAILFLYSSNFVLGGGNTMSKQMEIYVNLVFLLSLFLRYSLQTGKSMA